MFLSWLVFFNVHLWLLSLRFCISYDSVTSSVSRSLIYSDPIRHLLAHNADTHCHIVSSVSGGVEACCSSSFPFGLSPVVGVFIPFIQLEHTVSFVRSVYEAAYEEIILSSWRGNEEITHWDDITCLPEGKQKKTYTLLSYSGCFLACLCHVGLRSCPAVGLCHEVPPVEQTISEVSCALRGRWTDPFIQAGGGGAVHTGWTETTRWFCPEVTRVFTE